MIIKSTPKYKASAGVIKDGISDNNVTPMGKSDVNSVDEVFKGEVKMFSQNQSDIQVSEIRAREAQDNRSY